jgi:hypothetical protein
MSSEENKVSDFITELNDMITETNKALETDRAIIAKQRERIKELETENEFLKKHVKF